MKINASITKKTYGVMSIEIPDNELTGLSPLAVKRRINKIIDSKMKNNPEIKWDENDDEISYSGNYVKETE